MAPHLRRDRLGRRAHDLRGGARVDVLPPLERLDQGRLLREVREDPQLDLRVVGGHEAPPVLRDERLADAPAELGADRDVLEIRVRRRQPPRRRDQLVERGVDAPRPRIDEHRQRVGVRALELGELAVLEDLPGQRVPERQLLQHVGVGGVAGLGALDRRQLQLLEEHDRELLRRDRVERLAGELVDLAREVVELRSSSFASWPRRSGSTRMPCRSMSASTGTSGRSSVS